MDFDLIIRSVKEISAGFPVTISLSFMALFCGSFIGMMLCLMKMSRSKILNFISSMYIYYFRGTPLLVQMYLLYFGIGYYISINTDSSNAIVAFFNQPFWYAVISLMFNTAGYSAEIFRGGFLSVKKQQIEAAKAVGMSRSQVFYNIRFPQALRNFLPAYSNEVILIVKGSSLASVITVLEMTGIMNKIRSETYAIYELVLIAGIFYLLLNTFLIFILSKIEKKLTPVNSI